MNIGQAAKHSGLSAKMIRYYEDVGLLGAVKRSATGYRIYAAQDLRTLNFIQHARALGFSSTQMKALISLWQNHDRHSAEVKQLTLAHIQELNQKIKSLENMVAILQQASAGCAGDEGAECSILDQIAAGECLTDRHSDGDGAAKLDAVAVVTSVRHDRAGSRSSQ